MFKICAPKYQKDLGQLQILNIFLILNSTNYLLQHNISSSSIWYNKLSGAPKTTLDPMMKLQKHINCSMTFRKYTAYTQPLHQKLSLLNINNLYKSEKSKYMHKIQLNRNSILLCKYQQILQAHNYETQQSVRNSYFINRSCTELEKRQIKIKEPTIWLQESYELSFFLF